jgi:hypothetical protein
MKTIRNIVAGIILAVPLALSAAEVPDANLVGTWVQPPWTNSMPEARTAKWLSLTFQTNEIVKWEWVRNGKTETHSGVLAAIERGSASKGGQEHQTIRIFPDRSDLLAVVLESARVDADNRFPADWRVLKFKCGEESVVLVRKEDALRTSGPTVRATARP